MNSWGRWFLTWESVLVLCFKNKVWVIDGELLIKGGLVFSCVLRMCVHLPNTLSLLSLKCYFGQSWCCLDWYLCCWDNGQGWFPRFVWIPLFSAVNSSFAPKKIMARRSIFCSQSSSPLQTRLISRPKGSAILHLINVVR